MNKIQKKKLINKLMISAFDSSDRYIVSCWTLTNYYLCKLTTAYNTQADLQNAVAEFVEWLDKND